MCSYLLQIIILTFVVFVQIQANYTSTSPNHSGYTSISDSTASSAMTETSKSISYLSSIETSTSSATNPSISTTTDARNTHSYISSTYISSATSISSHEHSSLSSTSTTSPNTSPTSSTTTPMAISVKLMFKYTLNSSSPLKIGNFTDSTILNSVHNMVKSSFNLSNFIIDIKRIEIRSQAKSTFYEYDMITDNLFESVRKDCDIICIKNSAVLSSVSFQLQDINGSLVNVIAKSGPILIEDMSNTTPIPINYKKGDSPPGLPAKLGMGFGITIIGVLLIVEIIFLYRKFGLNNSSREANYEMPGYNH
ncbi:unnamed protein product [Adineta steineri]|uniref:SEA domain-containing protein n=1 Tax=Adineta steineri TaxID=433720 RepID=A0A813SFR6_9BILA|nr:unnamed protein product [Adineta steineri]CAF3981531.1 unnamed protein product [Adineta steineri]